MENRSKETPYKKILSLVVLSSLISTMSFASSGKYFVNVTMDSGDGCKLHVLAPGNKLSSVTLMCIGS